MNKNFIKKIIVTITFILFLIIFFYFVNYVRNSSYSDEISIVKSILKEKYDKVYYEENSKYIYTLKKDDDKYIYSLFDLNGNRLYKIISDNEIKFASINKKYYITKTDKYHLYNIESEEIISSNSMEGLNDYLIKVDDRIINYKNKEIFSNVYNIDKYDNSDYFCINNYYFIDKKGSILLENTIVIDEIKSREITKYFIIKKDDKLYTFYTNIDRIVGDGFDSYENSNGIYINIGEDKYKVYNTGLRKKVDDFEEVKEELTFEKGYKLKKEDNYTLYKNNKEIISLDKQIVVKGINIKEGKVDDEFYLYDLKNKEYYLTKKVKINKRNYYYYEKDNVKYIISSDYINKYKSNTYLFYDKNNIIVGSKNNIKIYNLKSKKVYKYKLENDEKIISKFPFRNTLIISGNNIIKVIDLKSNIIKEIKNKNLVKINYNFSIGKIIIITSKNEDNNDFEGSYVLE